MPVWVQGLLGSFSVSHHSVYFVYHRVCDIVGDVLFSTKASSPYDMALLQLRDSPAEAAVPRMAQRFNPGLISVSFSRNGKNVF